MRSQTVRWLWVLVGWLAALPAWAEDPTVAVVVEARYIEIGRAEANKLVGSTDYLLMPPGQPRCWPYTTRNICPITTKCCW